MPAFFRVFRIPRKKTAELEAALGDDRLSRESLHLYEARHFGLEGDDHYLIVEASPEGILRAEALILDFGSRAPDADAIHRAWVLEQEKMEAAMGAIFSADERDALG